MLRYFDSSRACFASLPRAIASRRALLWARYSFCGLRSGSDVGGSSETTSAGAGAQQRQHGGKEHALACCQRLLAARHDRGVRGR